MISWDQINEANPTRIIEMGHIQGQSRSQVTLFPEALEDFIPADHPVRVIDAFVNQLALAELGFSKAVPAGTGRPPYDPSDLLKLYIYGYLNRSRTSRRLEQECRRNVEVMWLLNRLAPDFKTIADFRRDNKAGVRRVCAAFVQFCRSMELFRGERVAIDGSKFAGQNARHRNHGEAGLKKRLAGTEAKIEAYLRALDAYDAEEAAADHGAEDTRAALAALAVRRAQILEWLREMAASGEQQVSLTDADARKMRTGQGEWVVGYNVQAAVETDTHLIVHHEVTQACNDRQQLAPMAEQTQAVLGAESLEVVADMGYSNATAAAQCEAAGVITYVPRECGVNTHGEYFAKDAFSYDESADTYRCPAGETLCFRGQSAAGERSYRSRACAGCALKDRCTKAAYRTVTRHVHERALEAMDARARTHPAVMLERKTRAEHPFGTLKQILDGARFWTRGLPSVGAEMALAVLAYNLRRVLNMKGVNWMLVALA
jgi:transposase